MEFACGNIFVRGGIILLGSVTFFVGKGTNVCFWFDWWVGDGVVNDVFPVLYVLLRIRGDYGGHFELERLFHALQCDLHVAIT